MADLAASVAAARKAGYSDAEIAAYIAKDPSVGPKVAAARKAGYSDADVVAHLGKVNVASDVGRSALSGTVRGIAGVGDTVGQAGPMGPLTSAVQSAAGLAENFYSLAHGKGVKARSMPNMFSGASQATASTAYKPQTIWGELADTTASMLPNAFAPGGPIRRIANVLVPALASEGAGQAARGLGADARGEAIARSGGALVGAGLTSIRPENLFARREAPTPLETMGERQRLDPAQMRSRTAEMRAAGVQPTLTDVVGEKGRRFIRAAGVKGEDAGEVLTNRANAVSAATKPAAIASARRLHPDQRTATQYADDAIEARDQRATRDYGAFDAEPVTIPETVQDMLADSSGRSIIARARADAIENQDFMRQAELDSLLRPTQDGQLPRISAGTIDRLVIAARERGTAFARRGNNNRARGAFARRGQLDQTLDRVDGLRPARQAYAESSRAAEVARGEGRMDPFTTDPADYQGWLQGLPPEARNANQIAIRQDLTDTLGGQRSGTFGTLDQLASSPYAEANLRQAFGPAADRYIAEIRARLAQTRNATFVQPNAGSRTAVLGEDVKNQATQAAGVVRQIASRDVLGLAARATDAWRGRGMRPQEAEALARLAVDPGQTDQAIAQIARRLEPQQRQEFLSLRNAALVGALGASGARSDRPEESRQR